MRVAFSTTRLFFLVTPGAGRLVVHAAHVAVKQRRRRAAGGQKPLCTTGTATSSPQLELRVGMLVGHVVAALSVAPHAGRADVEYLLLRVARRAQRSEGGTNPKARARSGFQGGPIPFRWC